MADLPYDPAQEKVRLSAAHGALHKHWGTEQMGQAHEELVEMVAHAEHVLAALTPHYETEGIAFRVHVLGLGCMIQYARDQIQGNSQSKIYHLPLCPGYGRVSGAHLVTFATEAAAKSAGYRKAKNCP